MADSALGLLLRSSESKDLLTHLLMQLGPGAVCSLARVSQLWALCAEVALQEQCRLHRWQPPRRARTNARGSRGAVAALLPWRAVFVGRACRGCLCAPGDFAVRPASNAAPLFFLCSACAKAEPVVRRLQHMNSTIDVTGLSGRVLYTRKGDKFCSDVSRFSKAALDAASGERADRQRR
jgi:hypothetical protein